MTNPTLTEVSNAVRDLRDAIELREKEHAQRLHELENCGRAGYRPDDTDSDREVSEGFGGWLHRTLVEGSGSGSYVVPEQYVKTSIWDRLAAKSVGLASGFTVIPTSSDTLHIPVLQTDAAAAWTAEATAINESAPGLSEIVAQPKKLAALMSMSNEVVEDSHPAILELAAGNALRSLALKLDLGFYEGSGTGAEIRGLKNVVGIQTVDMGTDGVAFDSLDPIADSISLLQQANAEATAIVMHPRTWGDLLKLKETNTSIKPLLQESAGSGSQGVERRLYGIPVLLSSQLASTETHGAADDASSVYVYEAPQVIAVQRAEARIELDRSRRFNEDISELRAVLRYDLAVPNPTAVVRISGVIPATA